MIYELHKCTYIQSSYVCSNVFRNGDTYSEVSQNAGNVLQFALHKNNSRLFKIIFVAIYHDFINRIEISLNYLFAIFHKSQYL